MKKNNFLRKIWYGLSAKQRVLIRQLYYFPKDFRDQLEGKTHKYVPARGKIYTGSPASAENYIKQSYHQLNILKKEIFLKPSDCVLDIGSGVGRTAISLTEYLGKTGKYEGFDVVKEGVDWCNTRIKKDFPNFNFTYIPIFNDLYNDAGDSAESFVFPYEEEFFDKIFSFSVFTHMGISEIENYFLQINKTLKKDGKSLSTFFLFDDHNENFIAKRNNFEFPIKKDGYRLMNESVVSGNIAIHKDKLTEMAEKANLKIIKIIDGFWKDDIRDSSKTEYQDIVVFEKII